MKCEVVRQRLAAAFDASKPLSNETETHLKQCPACARYQAALAELEEDLLDISAAPTPDGLAARIKMAVAEEREIRPSQSAARWGVGMAACAGAAVAGWFYPLPWDIRLWWYEIDAWRDPGAWQALRVQLFMPFRELWADVAGVFDQGAGLLSPMLLWGGVGGAALVLILFNAFEAHHLEAAARREVSRHARG